MRHPRGRLIGSLVIYDQLAALRLEAIANCEDAQTIASIWFWCQEIEAAEQMLSYCPEHWAVVEAVRIVGEAQERQRD